MIRKHTKLSWRKDKFDPRDFIHGIHIPKLDRIPAVFNLSQFCPDVRDQGNIGSCTGFGIGGIITGVAKQKGVYKEWFSPNWIYNGERFIEGTLTEDAGAEPGDGMDWLKKMGCLLEEFWPYQGSTLDTTSPPSKDNPLALQWPLITYYRVTGGSAGICSALAAGNFVTIGTPWFDDWMDPGTTGVLSSVTPNSSVAGGHMTFLYGYDQTKMLFSGQNSWSSSWGQGGRYSMPFNVFDSVFGSLGGYDAYYVTVSWGSSPTPPTPPAPPVPPTPPAPTPTLTSISVTPGSVTEQVGTLTQFTATGKYSDGSTRDITFKVSWASSKATVAIIGPTGLAKAMAAGTVTISAVSGNIMGSTILVVVVPTPPPVPPAPTVVHTIRVQDSTDGGQSWSTLFQQNLSTKK